MKNKKILSLLGLITILSLFVLFSYLVSENKDLIQGYVVNDYYGMAFYLLIMILETVIAPTSFFPLVAVASNLWGWVITGFLNWIGWLAGSLIIFWIVRKVGICLVHKFIQLEKIAEVESYISKENKFISLVFLRIFVPADLLSYALSFLTNISFRTYFWTSLIGIAPFSFIVAYLGILPISYQIIGIVLSLIVLGTGFLIASKNKKRKLRAEQLKKEIRLNIKKECKI